MGLLDHLRRGFCRRAREAVDRLPRVADREHARARAAEDQDKFPPHRVRILRFVHTDPVGLLSELQLGVQRHEEHVIEVDGASIARRDLGEFDGAVQDLHGSPEILGRLHLQLGRLRPGLSFLRLREIVLEPVPGSVTRLVKAPQAVFGH